MTQPELSESAKALIARVEVDPNNWLARKSAAVKLYMEQRFLEAADIIWNTPEMPATDIDVAFSVKIISRVRPNRSIRLVYEVLRRNVGKAEQNMAMARAFNLIGLPMLASRFYGAALAIDHEYFDIGFEQQSLWYDDTENLLGAWEKHSENKKPSFSQRIEAFVGDSINCASLPDAYKAASALTASTLTASVSARMPSPQAMVGPPVPESAKQPVTPQEIVLAAKEAEARRKGLARPAVAMAPPTVALNKPTLRE